MLGLGIRKNGKINKWEEIQPFHKKSKHADITNIKMRGQEDGL